MKRSRMKTCSNCHLSRAHPEFYRDRRKRDGLSSTCKECSKARSRAWAEAHPERARDTTARWRQNNLHKLRGYNLKWEYGLSSEEYQLLYDRQDGRCGICSSYFDVLCVDHDHATGAVRGLLCRRCNSALGGFSDDSTRLRQALAYLEKYPCKADIFEKTYEPVDVHGGGQHVQSL
jgi:hypothetical protein